MAGKNIFGKVMETVKIPNVVTINTSINSIKKEIEEKVKEKNQLYSFIGMEVYDQCLEKKLEIAGIDVYLEKMQALDSDIQELEARKQSMELQQKGSTVCQCGCVLNANQSFCPNCGREVDNGKLICVCGNEVSKTEKFCSKCGASVEQLLQQTETAMQTAVAGFGIAGSNAAQASFKTCICGAKVPEGQFMCMECGRKVD